MKRAFVVAFCFISLFSNGQQKKTIEISAHINSIDPLPALGNFLTSSTKILGSGNFINSSICGGLTAKYFIEENCALYLKSVYTKRSYKERQEIFNTSLQINENITTQHIFKLAPGIQWSIPYRKVAFLAGFDIPITFYGEILQHSNTYTDDLIGIDKTNVHSEFKIPGGLIYGIGIFGGLNYYFIKKCAVGFTLGSAYEHTKIGGNIKWHSVTTGTINDEFYLSYEDSIKDLAFSPLQASLTVTWKIR